MGESPGWAQPSVPSGFTAPNSPDPAGSSHGEAPAAPLPPGRVSPAAPASGYDLKPAIVPLRPLAVGEILDGGFAVVRQHPRLVFGIALVLGAVVALVNVGLGLVLRNVGDVIATTAVGSLTFGGLGAQIFGLLVNAVFGAILTGIVAGLIGKEILGESVDDRETLRLTARRYKALIAAGVLAGGLPYLPFTFLVIGVVGWVPALVLGVYLWGQLALALPAMVLERLGPVAAIKRSWSLVKGGFWRVWGMRALAYLACSVAAALLTLGFTYRAAWERGHHEAVTVAATIPAIIGEVLAWMVAQPVLAGAVVLIYVDRRIRAEGLDIQLARAARAASAAASATGGL